MEVGRWLPTALEQVDAKDSSCQFDDFCKSAPGFVVNGSLLLTSQSPPDRWYDLFNDPTVADAILDRVVHRAHRLELQGESLRKLRGKGTETSV